VAIRENRPIETGVSQYLETFTSHLKKLIKNELTHELANLEDKQHWLTLEQIFIENRIYKRIEKAKSEQQVKKQVYEGMKTYSHLFIREMTDDDVRRLLDLRIRRISAYDIEKYREQIEEVVALIAQCRAKLRSLTKTTIGYLQDLIKKYAVHFQRRSEITHFEAVDRKSVAKANIRLGYDRKTGFFGSGVKEQDRQLTVSSYDRILAISSDGTYRIMAPPDKVLLPKRLIYCARFDQEKGLELTLVYRDTDKVAWAKRVRIDKFITDKVYDLCKSSPSGIDYLNSTGKPHTVRLHFVPKKRQKINDTKVDLKLIKPCGLTARGTRLHAKPVRRIEVLTAGSI
jgi:topoisomerase-4 subunit A